MDCQDYNTEFMERKKGQHLQREDRGAIQHFKLNVASSNLVSRSKLIGRMSADNVSAHAVLFMTWRPPL